MNNAVYTLVAPIKDAAHHARVMEDLEQARRFDDSFGTMIMLAQLTHPESWKPTTAEQPALGQNVDGRA